jgi:polyribonucleotide nucleotidyltransferase
MTIQNVELKIGDNLLVIETGRVAKQADGACILRYGDTVLLATVCTAPNRGGFSDFMPLTIDFRERTYAYGKIPGGFFKREGKPSSEAVLAARLVDRPIRPMFPDNFKQEVQIVIMPLAVDDENSPQSMGITAASAALMVSGIPFDGPVAGIRMGKIGDKFIVNPTNNELKDSEIDLIVAGTKEAITMVEAGASIVSEDVMLEAITKAHEEIKKLCEVQIELRKKVNPKPVEFDSVPTDEELTAEIKKAYSNNVREAVKIFDKLERQKAMSKIEEEAIEKYKEKFEDDEWEEKLFIIKNSFESMVKDQVRDLIVSENFRADGRKVTDIRPIECMVQVLPKVHGSALFTRGQTQSLGVVTLGSARDSQSIDSMGDEFDKSFMLHYNFPPYSVGEVKPLRGPGRREIGHGALAERAISAVIPSDDDFPYTIRAVSEILESNGSSSMASICSCTMALMDAGVPIKKPVAGIAMGLVKEENDFVVLTDIQGLEDHYGDMDFKVAGTEDGITALQMDIKIKGLSTEIMKQALKQAKEARLFILGKMNEAINTPREELSPNAPRMIGFSINTDKIKDVIGAGGKNIRKIIDDTGVDIDIQNDGSVKIFSSDSEAAARAENMIKAIITDPEVGQIYKGKVTRIMKFGAFVEILPGKEGLVHISQLSKERVNRVEDVVEIGDELEVKVVEIDNMGRLNLSHKVLL